MKKILAIIIVLFVLPLVSADLLPVPCADWYEYPLAEFSFLAVDKPSYKPGDSLMITAQVNNTEPHPLVEGSVRAHVLYLDGEEEYILGELFLDEDINLMPGETVTASGNWTVPKNAKAGTYRAAVHLISADDFNLNGVSFLRGIHGRAVEFQVTDGSGLLYFATADLKMNGEIISLHLPSNAYDPGTAVEVELPLMNEGSATEAKVKYEIYLWDDLNGDLKSSSEETVSLGAGESKLLTYTVPGTLPAGAYMLKMTATSPKNSVVVKIRVPIEGKHVKLNFAGIDTFPLKAGEPAKLFLCVSNSAESGVTFYTDEEGGAIQGNIKDGALRVTLGADGDKVFEGSASGLTIGGQMTGYEVSFTPEKDLGDLTLGVEATDEDGNKDAVEMDYTVAKLIKERGISLDVSVAGDQVTFTVSLDAMGAPASGPVELHVTDTQGTGVLALSADVEGTYEATRTMQPGKYTIMAMEQNSLAMATASFEVVSAERPLPKPTPEPAADNTILILILLVIIVVLAVLALKRQEISKRFQKEPEVIE